MNAVQTWGQTAWALPMRVKAIIASVTVLTVIVMIIVVRGATATAWVPVVENVEPRQAGDANQSLIAADIRTQLIDNGSTVQVPKGDLSQARVTLAESGDLSASNHSTYEDLFKSDSNALSGMTEQELELTKQKYLEDKIAADIEQINGVDKANVTLALPEDDLFSVEEKDASAVVALDTNGQGLSKSQVKGIQQLVASAVNDVQPRTVAIIDEEGSPLTDDSADGGFTSSEAAREVERRWVTDQQRRLNDQMERIAGEGNVTAMLDANLDLDAVQEEIEQYGGETNVQGPIASENLERQELETDGGTTNGGVVGTGTNIGTNGTNQFAQVGTGGTGASSDFVEEKAAREYSNDTVKQMVQRAPGNVLDMQLAVVAHQDLPSDTLAAIDNTARTFINKSQNAENNTYSMTSAPLPRQVALEDDIQSLAQREAFLNGMKWVALFIGLIGLAWWLNKTLGNRTIELLEQEDAMLALDSGFDPVPLAELEAALGHAGNVGSHERIALQRKVENIARDKPDEAAMLVRSWLHER